LKRPYYKYVALGQAQDDVKENSYRVSILRAGGLGFGGDDFQFGVGESGLVIIQFIANCP
jgi:hypothetical protein